MEEESVACELFANRAWTPISLDHAMQMPRSRLLRCLECRGRVRAHRQGSDGQRAHLEHYERHTGCSRGDCFAGVSTLHPRALA